MALANQETRIDSEWVAVNAFRELLKLSTKGDPSKATYDHALEMGGELYPDLLGPESSLLRRARESDTTREYRQRAALSALRSGSIVNPLDLLQRELSELEDLLHVAAKNKSHRGQVEQLKRKLALFRVARSELAPEPHSENQLIFRDAYNIHRVIPAIQNGKGTRDFELPDGNILRVRVLHPDKPEHVTGADIVYERHAPHESKASIVAVQYKMWTNKTMSLSDGRMQLQLGRLKGFACSSGLCDGEEESGSYRFPFCAAFLRPTDKLQRTDQKLLSTGEHLPICQIGKCSVRGPRGAPTLTYDSIRTMSLSGEVFESLFNAGKIGSRMLDYEQLKAIYEAFKVEDFEDRVVIHAQEFDDGLH